MTLTEQDVIEALRTAGDGLDVDAIDLAAVASRARATRRRRRIATTSAAALLVAISVSLYAGEFRRSPAVARTRDRVALVPATPTPAAGSLGFCPGTASLPEHIIATPKWSVVGDRLLLRSVTPQHPFVYEVSFPTRSGTATLVDAWVVIMKPGYSAADVDGSAQARQSVLDPAKQVAAARAIDQGDGESLLTLRVTSLPRGTYALVYLTQLVGRAACSPAGPDLPVTSIGADVLTIG
jgi:hypothetical protein